MARKPQEAAVIDLTQALGLLVRRVRKPHLTGRQLSVALVAKGLVEQ